MVLRRRAGSTWRLEAPDSPLSFESEARRGTMGWMAHPAKSNARLRAAVRFKAMAGSFHCGDLVILT
ncbi:hypothetical protein D3C87_1313140 [compost metagenome]